MLSVRLICVGKMREKFYTDAFFEDFKKVNCRVPDIVSPATENIEEYIKIITKLSIMDKSRKN